MKPQIKSQYFNGRDTVVEIYHTEFKILETKSNTLWNATEDEPITVTFERYKNDDYIVSDIRLDDPIKSEEIIDATNQE